MLYLVPTPIGNMKDITLRAIDILNSVEYILAEDTRTTGKLLNRYDISTSMKPYHAHNEHKVTPLIVEQLVSGIDLALVTDAGTPAISDPGFLLVRACHEAGIQVSCLPGPSALICGLACAGIPCERFFFEGFLPHKKGRKTRWAQLQTIDETIVLYESPHRIMRTLRDIHDFFGPEKS